MQEAAGPDLPFFPNERPSPPLEAKATSGPTICIVPLGHTRGEVRKSLVSTVPIHSDSDRVSQGSNHIAKRLEMALRTGKIGLWQFNTLSEKIEWDEHLREMFGVSATQLLPRDAWERALHPKDRDRVITASIEAIKIGCDFDLDYRILRPSGETRFIRSRVSVQTECNGSLTLVGVNWDETDEKLRIKQLEKLQRVTAAKNQALEQSRIDLERSALHDFLTGLPNRLHLERTHQRACHIAGRTRRRFGVFQIDLDGFKQVNDTLGHQAGDHVLASAAKRLKACVGNLGLVARVGGDEFAVFFENAPPPLLLTSLARSIIAAAAQPFTVESRIFRLGMSVGIAFADTKRERGKDLFVHADLALYAAKRSGRGQCAHYNDNMRIAALRQKAASDEVMSAVEKQELCCVYQPQYDARTGALTGLEALVRWKHPSKGLLLPSSFLETANRIQVIARVDQIVLRCVEKDMAKWQRRGINVPRISINVSQARLKSPDLWGDLGSIDLDPTRISFELLETDLIKDEDAELESLLLRLRAFGIGIDIDDFGTGHTSIKSLLTIMPDRLKIDKAITKPVVDSERHRRLVRAIIDIAKVQNICVIAEGVESIKQAQLLRQSGCDELQGYGLNLPTAPYALATVLRPRATWF